MNQQQSPPRYTLYDGEIPPELRLADRHEQPYRAPTSADFGVPKGFVHNPKTEVMIGRRALLLGPWEGQYLKDNLRLDLVDPVFYKTLTYLWQGYHWLAMIVTAMLFSIVLNPIFLYAIALLGAFYCSHYLVIASFGHGEGVVLRLKIAGMTLKEITFYVAPPIRYDEPNDVLWNPPSVISLVKPPRFSTHLTIADSTKLSMRRDDPQVASGILCGTLLGLWANDIIQFRLGILQRQGALRPRNPALYLLLVNIGDLNQPVLLGNLENRIIRAIQQWNALYGSPHMKGISRTIPTIGELLFVIAPMLRHTLAEQVIKDAVKTAVKLDLAKPRRDGLDFKSTVRDFIMHDAATLQIIADTADTHYQFVASEIEYALGNAVLSA